MDRALEAEVRSRAARRCEYCHTPESASTLPHAIDHIIARKHHGETVTDNLALCCGQCNRHKGTNLSGIDPVTRRLTPLFHPRRQTWADHFQWQGPVLVGLTDVGRTTVDVLSINLPGRVAARQALIEEGTFPPG